MLELNIPYFLWVNEINNTSQAASLKSFQNIIEQFSELLPDAFLWDIYHRTNRNKPKSLCYELARGFENQGYYIFMVNYNSSIPLLKSSQKRYQLHRNHKKDRKEMQDLNSLIRKESGEYLSLNNCDLTLALWHDKKIVTAISGGIKAIKKYWYYHWC